MEELIGSLQKLAYLVRLSEQDVAELREELLKEIVYLDDRISDDINSLKDKLKHTISDHADDLDLIEEERIRRKQMNEEALELETRIFRLVAAQENLKPIQNNLYHEQINPKEALRKIEELNKKFFLENYFPKKMRSLMDIIESPESEEHNQPIIQKIPEEPIESLPTPKEKSQVSDRSVNVNDGTVNIDDKSINVNVQFDVNVPKQDQQ